MGSIQQSISELADGMGCMLQAHAQLYHAWPQQDTPLVLLSHLLSPV